MCIGAAIRVMSYRALGRHFTFQLSIRKDHKLVKDGPYSIVRHPSYTGGVLTLIGTALSILWPWGSVYAELGLWKNMAGCAMGLCLSSMVVFGLVVAVFRSREEDLALKTELKEEWDAWAKRTPWRVFPGIF